jgi:outer membrane beta-barrel protein
MKTPDIQLNDSTVGANTVSGRALAWRVLGVIGILGWLALMAYSWVEDANASDDPEYDFSWLDPDKKVQVLQNRRYRKALHPMISVLGGPVSNDPFRTSYVVDPRVTFHLSEQFAFEGFYSLYFNSENTFFDALSQTSPNALPTMRESRSRYGGLFQWSPWYAKINVFNAILYFDWYFSVGAGVLNTALDLRESTSDAASFKDESNFAIFASTGHQYHVNEWLKIRMDVTSAFYNTTIARGGTEKDWFTDTAFTLGLGVRL